MNIDSLKQHSNTRSLQTDVSTRIYTAATVDPLQPQHDGIGLF